MSSSSNAGEGEKVIKGWRSSFSSLVRKKVRDENNKNLLNSGIISTSKKKGLINRSVSKLSLNNLFPIGHYPTPNRSSGKKSTSVADLREAGIFGSPFTRKSFRSKTSEIWFKTPVKRDNKCTIEVCPPSSSSSSSSSGKCKAIIRRHSSKLWSETIDRDTLQRIKERLSGKEIRRQEAVFELLQGERDMIDDFNLITNTYHRPMRNLGILRGSDADVIFLPFDALRPLHHYLASALSESQDSEGVFSAVGTIILEWVSGLSVYESYCYNLPKMNQTIDVNLRNNIKFADFLERCLESPFSRKLDLKTLLDAPRHRLMKYPLLLKSIKKYTLEESPDYPLLESAIKKLEFVVGRVDEKMGEAECRSVVDKLDFDRTHDIYGVIFDARMVHCKGVLKNGRGTKLFCVLFDTGFIVTRPNHDNSIYLLYRKPIPMRNLCFETKNTFRVSFRSASTLSSSPTNWIRVYSAQNDSSFLLLPIDEHSYKQWISKLTRFARKNLYDPLTLVPTASTSNTAVSPRKRPSTGSTVPVLSPKRNKSEFLKAIFV